MSATPLLVIAAVSAISALARQVVALIRYQTRRASIERLVAGAKPGSRVVDRDADGAVVDVTVRDTTKGPRAVGTFDRPAGAS